MNLRQQQEKIEDMILSQYASKSSQSKGRSRYEEPCDIRTEYQRDRDRIIHSKAFRRLKHKTQVFISPEGDHYRTRLTHTLEVAQIGRTVARALRLNEDLTEAIALGHDLGHTPFGHAGEKALDMVSEFGFKHYEQSIRIVEILENKGEGLNLTWEVRDGILNHPTKGSPATQEGKIIRLSDKIAYINHDIDDAIRAKILDVNTLPKEALDILGRSAKERINNMIHDIVRNSVDTGDIIMSEEMAAAMHELRHFMFKHVYIGSKAKTHEKKAQDMLVHLFDHFRSHDEDLPVEYASRVRDGLDPLDQVISDYIAGMTDRFAITTFTDLFIPSSWKE